MTKQKSAKDFDGDRIETGCGCVFCDIGLTPERREGQLDPVHMVKGVPMPCLKK